MCVYSPGTFSVICAELLPQELTSVSPHVIIAQSDYEERGRGRDPDPEDLADADYYPTLFVTG